MHFSCWCMCSMFVFKRFFSLVRICKEAKRFIQASLDFLPVCLVHRVVLHSICKSFIVIWNTSFPFIPSRRSFFKSVNFCCLLQNKTTHHILIFFSWLLKLDDKLLNKISVHQLFSLNEKVCRQFSKNLPPLKALHNFFATPCKVNNDNNLPRPYGWNRKHD